jgi:hypothetical protein
MGKALRVRYAERGIRRFLVGELRGHPLQRESADHVGARRGDGGKNTASRWARATGNYARDYTNVLGAFKAVPTAVFARFIAGVSFGEMRSAGDCGPGRVDREIDASDMGLMLVAH